MRSFVVLSKFVREAATGHGIDGHLLGLRHMICPEIGERAASSMSRCSKEGTPAPPTLLVSASAPSYRHVATQVYEYSRVGDLFRRSGYVTLYLHLRRRSKN